MFTSVDWLGLTAEIVTSVTPGHMFVVNNDGDIELVDSIDVEYTTIDLIDYTLFAFGPEALGELLDARQVMLSYNSFVNELDEYWEKYDG